MYFPIQVFITVSNILKQEITSTQAEALRYKHSMTEQQNELNLSLDFDSLKKTGEFEYYSAVKYYFRKSKQRLRKLHTVIKQFKLAFKLQKYSQPVHGIFVNISESELQFILTLLRSNTVWMYDNLSMYKRRINRLFTVAVKDGTLNGKINFLKLNQAKNIYRKSLKEVKVVEKAVKMVKLVLRSKTKAAKKESLLKKFRRAVFNLTHGEK